MVATQLGSTGPSAAHRRARRRLIAAIAALSLALGVMLGMAGFFWHSALDWQASSSAWEDQARRQGNEVAVLTAQLDGTTGQITEIEGQLGEATNRITTLADEKAQLGDENAVRQFFLEQQQANLDYHGKVTAAAAGAADALISCTESQAELIELLQTVASEAAQNATAADPTVVDPTVTDSTATDLVSAVPSATNRLASEQTQLANTTDRLCADAAARVATLRELLAAKPADPDAADNGTADTVAVTDSVTTDVWNDVTSPASRG